MGVTANKCSYKNSVIIDRRTYQQTIVSLESLGFKIVFAPQNTAVYDSISGHPDITICKIADGLLAAAPEFRDYYSRSLPNSRIICGHLAAAGAYPGDIGYNAAVVGDVLIHNMKYTDKAIRNYFKKTISVKQGYTKCSVCVVSDNALITADAGIYDALKKDGRIDVLKVQQGYVELIGMEYGFIGGASGLLEKDLLGFNGNIKMHPDWRNIKDFCKNHGVNVISLANEPLMDIGSIIAERLA